MFKRAKYRGIPCWYNEQTDELRTNNWLYGVLVNINLWVDFQLLGLEKLPIWIIEDE
jgi:hypothetical protein